LGDNGEENLFSLNPNPILTIKLVFCSCKFHVAYVYFVVKTQLN